MSEEKICKTCGKPMNLKFVHIADIRIWNIPKETDLYLWGFA